MGRICAVFGCKNNSARTKARGETIIYHRFPNGNNSESSTLGKEWVRRCRRVEKLNPNTSQICSIHFSNTDYERDLQSELLGLPPKKKLKKTAVPTLNLPLCEIQSELATQVDPLKLEIEEVAYTLQANVPDNGHVESSLTGVSDLPACEANLAPNLAHLERLTESLELKYAHLLEKFNELQLKHTKLKHDSRKKIKALNDQVNYYKKKCYKMNKTEKTQTV